MSNTGELFLDFYRCAYKACLEATGAGGELSEFERFQREADLKFSQQAIEDLVRRTSGDQITRRPESQATAIREGSRLILGVQVEAIGVSLVFDALERQDVGHGDGPPVYVPVLFSHRNKLSREDSLLAALHGLVLAEASGQPVPFVKIAHGSCSTTTKIKLQGPSGPTKLVNEARQILEKLRKQVESATAPPMVLNDHCPCCEFRSRCRAEAVRKDDLSLLRGMPEKEMQALRRRGITTVAQLAGTFRPKSVGAKRNKPPKRHLHALQALAVRDKKVYVVRKPEFPADGIRVYLDVEGIPDRDFYYLVGVVVEKAGEVSPYSFWANDEAGEQVIWANLLALLRALGDYALFHYGSYERSYFTKMLRKYHFPDSPVAEGWASASINVLGLIRTNVYFPAYSNGLKDVASSLGVSWEGEISSGLDCLARRLRWDASGDPLVKEQIIAYNLLDCLAVQRVVHFLSALGSPEGMAASGAVRASDITVEGPWRFGKINFQFPEMDLINRCARFDYQQSKVLLRTDPGVRASVRRKASKPRVFFKANVEIRCNPSVCCPACGGSRLTTFRNGLSKLVYDLVFTRSGVRRRVVKYVSERQESRVCGETFLAPTYPKSQKVGHSLSCWAVYQHIALRLSFEDIATNIYDLFGYPLCEATGKRAQTRLAMVYRETQDRMLDRLRSGGALHADETKIEVKGGCGYVWAFSGTEMVVYLYNPTREGTFLKETIQNFSGVLVSDFYAAYDSLECPQQKCHLHLMRDINDDLLKHPFDDELRELARRYTLVLKPIVDTIDKHGLRAKHLSRHQGKVRCFLDWAAKSAPGSEIARGYKGRFEKYGERLFTFLAHDGVPWNNNLAENAIKLVASRRRLFGKSVSESGLKDYLVFLSIYQTLRRKGLSLLKFLLSGETDLEKYVASHRRR